MKRGGGKSKGNSFEREYAKKISLFLTGGQRTDACWRTSNSGGRATVNKSDTHCGDLCATRPEAEKFFSTFSLELKNYKAIDFLHFNKEKFILYDWWKQASDDALRSNRHPLIIFRINRKGDFLCTSDDVLSDLTNKDILSCSDFSGMNKLMIHNIKWETLVVTDIDLLWKFKV